MCCLNDLFQNLGTGTVNETSQNLEEHLYLWRWNTCLKETSRFKGANTVNKCVWSIEKKKNLGESRAHQSPWKMVVPSEIPTGRTALLRMSTSHFMKDLSSVTKNEHRLFNKIPDSLPLSIGSGNNNNEHKFLVKSQTVSLSAWEVKIPAFDVSSASKSKGP